MTPDALKEKIIDKIPSAVVQLNDLTGGGDHWQVTIKAKEFKGKSLVEQHQMVYRALGDLMKEKIHALSITTQELP